MDSPATQTITIVATGPGGTTTTTTVLEFPAFQLIAGSTTPNDLPTSLTHNGVVMDLAFSCNATSAGLTCTPDTVSEAGAGTSPVTTTLTAAHALDSTERGLTFVAGQKRLSPAAAGTFDLTTEDFILALAVRSPAVSAVLLDKSLASTDGWKVSDAGGNIRLSMRTGSTTTLINAPGATTNTSTGLTVFVVDRDEASTSGAVGYTNGLAGTGVDVSARAASMSNAVIGAIGAVSGGTSTVSTILALRLFKCPASNKQCFAGGAGGAAAGLALAKDWTAITFGMQPTLAVGIDSPTTMTRASIAFVDVVDGLVRHLYNFGNAAPRVAIRTASSVAVRGYLSEPTTTQLALQNQTLGTTWAAITGGDNVLANTWTPPWVHDGIVGDDIDGNNSDAEHGLRQAITLTATTYTLSAWVRAGSQTVVALRDNTVANAIAYFNLTTCAGGVVGEDVAGAVGTTGAGVSRANAQRWPVDSTGDGVVDLETCRVSITFTGTAAAHDIDILCASADNDATYLDADATVDCGFAGIEVEAFPDMTSLQTTTTAAVARSADDLRYDGASHYTASPTTMDTKVLCPNFDVGASSTFASAGAATTDHATVGTISTTDFPRTFGRVANSLLWDISGASGDPSDGSAHSVRGSWVTNLATLYYDGASNGTPDTVNTLPSAASSFIWLGTSGGTAAQSACLLTNLRIWSRDVTPTEAP